MLFNRLHAVASVMAVLPRSGHSLRACLVGGRRRRTQRVEGARTGGRRLVSVLLLAAPISCVVHALAPLLVSFVGGKPRGVARVGEAVAGPVRAGVVGRAVGEGGAEAALRALGAWSFSLLASSPSSGNNQRNGPESASRGTKPPARRSSMTQ
jgi:hypothetical protein